MLINLSDLVFDFINLYLVDDEKFKYLTKKYLFIIGNIIEFEVDIKQTSFDDLLFSLKNYIEYLLNYNNIQFLDISIHLYLLLNKLYIDYYTSSPLLQLETINFIMVIITKFNGSQIVLNNLIDFFIIFEEYTFNYSELYYKHIFNLINNISIYMSGYNRNNYNIGNNLLTYVNKHLNMINDNNPNMYCKILINYFENILDNIEFYSLDKIDILLYNYKICLNKINYAELFGYNIDLISNFIEKLCNKINNFITIDVISIEKIYIRDKLLNIFNEIFSDKVHKRSII